MNEKKKNIDNASSFTNELQLFINNELIQIAKSELPFRKTIPLIQSLFSETFHFVESQFFFDNPEFTDLNKAAQSSEIFLTIIRSLVENGILDWVLEQRSVQILPNLDLSTNEIFQKVLIYPIKRKQSNVFFIATLAPDSLLHNYKDLENLPNIFELSLTIIIDSFINETSAIQTNKKSINETTYFKLLYIAARSGIIDFLIQGLKTSTKAISAQLQFLVTNNEFTESRINTLTEYLSFTNLYINRISNFKSNDYNPIKLNLKALIQEIIQIIQPISNTNEISLSFFADEGDYFINTDRNYIEIALFCILVNSIESIENSGSIKVMLQKNENRRISLSIIDNGIGIAESDLTRIFNAMWTTKDPKKHLGVGLTFVQLFLNSMNAKFSISSDAAKGTNFKIVFSNTLV